MQQVEICHGISRPAMGSFRVEILSKGSNPLLETMNVYVLILAIEYEGCEVLAVFNSKTKAIKSAQSRQKTKLVWDSYPTCIQAKTQTIEYFIIEEHRIQ